MPCTFTKTELDGVILVEPRQFADGRGVFMETYKQSEFIANGIAEEFVQDNHSVSSARVIRGLHFQNSPHGQGKLVRCLAGSIWDVAVDIRKGSPTYGKWVGYELSAENRKMLYIPVGFAHGFAVLGEGAEVAYKTTGEYSPSAEAGVIWNDPALKIAWPISEPLLSEKDELYPYLAEADNQFAWSGNA